MTLRELRILIESPYVSDTALLITLKEMTSEKSCVPVSEEEMNELSKLGELTRQLRPTMMQEFTKWYGEEHTKTCLACRTLFS